MDIKKNNMESRVLSEKELAAELGLSIWSVRSLRLKLGLPHFRTSRRIFYRLDTVQAWMAAKEEQSSNMIIKSEVEEYGKLRKIQ